MADSSRFIFAVVVATILVLAMVGVMGLLMVVNTNRRHRHRADLAEADLRREREVLRAEREATEHTLVEVGRELHDNVGQLLTVTQMGLHTAQTERPQDQQLSTAMEALAQGIEEVRRLGRALNTDLWKERSLVDALDAEVLRLQRLDRAKVELVVTGDPKDPPSDAKIILFRTCQEILNNTMRHSRATQITIDLSGNQRMQLQIMDNGVGFDTGRVRNGGGLKNIPHRCALIGYHATLQASPGEGCIWTLTPDN